MFHVSFEWRNEPPPGWTLLDTQGVGERYTGAGAGDGPAGLSLPVVVENVGLADPELAFERLDTGKPIVRKKNDIYTTCLKNLGLLAPTTNKSKTAKRLEA